MKIENRLVDKERVNYPISGTKLRKDAELQNEWALIG